MRLGVATKFYSTTIARILEGKITKLHVFNNLQQQSKMYGNVTNNSKI